MTPRARMATDSVLGYVLGFIGVTIVVATLAFHFWLAYRHPELKHEFLYVPITAGAVLGWWGFYWARPKRAEHGGEVLADQYLKIRGTVQPGRRGGDPPVIAVTVKPEQSEEVDDGSDSHHP